MKKSFELFFMFAVLLNVMCIVVSTMPEFTAYDKLFDQLDIIFLLIFGFEYVCRLWLAPKANPLYKGLTGRLRYVVTPFALVDAIALLPVLFVGVDTQSTLLRVIRLLSIFRILKMLRYEQALDNVVKAVWHKRGELVVVFVCLLVFMLLTASAMYMLEREAQPKVFNSIPAALWWAIISITTIGYGDIVPMTNGGKVLASLCAFVGVLLIAIPTSIVSSSFLELRDAKKRSGK
jgi:voltage-gated potassium channel